MPKGSLLVQITDMRGGPIRQRVDIDLDPADGPAGIGGEPMELSVLMGSSIDLEITGIVCHGGIPTTYKIMARTPHHRVYSFFQPIREDRVNKPTDDIEFWVKQDDVTDIKAPKFDDLPAHLRGMLTSAGMLDIEAGDSDLAGLTGAALYRKLGPLRKACLLNIAKKAADSTSEKCFASFGRLLVCRQDRIYARVDAALQAQLTNSDRYTSENPALHDPLPGFHITGSLKTRDPHANLQLTFMQHDETGDMAADIDLDESRGILHGFEVIENELLDQKTNPFLIREFLLASDPIGKTLDPGYDFVF